MGVGSSVAHIFNKENPRLKLFVSGKSIAQDAEGLKSFFTSFLEFDITNVTEKEVEDVAAEFCKSLAANNGNTHNLQKLIGFVVQQMQTLPVGSPVTNSYQTYTQCSNGLFLLRIFLKHLVDTSGESVIQAVGLDDLWGLVKALIDFIVDHAVTEHTYMIHVYALQVILMLLATQMYSTFAPAGTPPSMLVYILLRGWRAHQLTHTLLRHVIAQLPRLAPPTPTTPTTSTTTTSSTVLPTTTQNSAPPSLHASLSSVTATLSSLPISLAGNPAVANRGFFKVLGNAANFILQLPFHAYTLLFATSAPLASPLTSETYGMGPCVLADTSFLVLLTLLVQPPPLSLSLLPSNVVLSQSSTILLSKPVNPYRECLCNLRDTEYTQELESPIAAGDADILRVSMKDLYNVLTNVIPFDDRTILLLYYLIHGNPQFLSYLFAIFISSTPPASSTPTKRPTPPVLSSPESDLDLDDIMAIDTTTKSKPKKSNPAKTQSKNENVETPKKSNIAKKAGDAQLKNFTVSCGKEPQKAVCGISRIWTARSHRRQGIASKLLDAVRANMIYGYTVPKELCAFSQPTADGKLFFENYRGTTDFLVYL